MRRHLVKCRKCGRFFSCTQSFNSKCPSPRPCYEGTKVINCLCVDCSMSVEGCNEEYIKDKKDLFLLKLVS